MCMVPFVDSSGFHKTAKSMQSVIPAFPKLSSRAWIWSGVILAGLNLVVRFSTGVAHAVAVLPHAQGIGETAAMIPLILVVILATALMTIGWVSNATDIFYEEVDLLQQDIRRSFVLLVAIGAGYIAAGVVVMLALNDANRMLVLARSGAPVIFTFCALCLINGAVDAVLAIYQKTLTRTWPHIPWETAAVVHPASAGVSAIRR